MSSALVNRCPHRSEIQSIVLAETESKLLVDSLEIDILIAEQYFLV